MLGCVRAGEKGRRQGVSRTSTSVDAIDPLEHQDEFIAPELPGSVGIGRERERAPLKALVEHDEAIAVPKQELDMRPCLVHEDEDIARQWITVHCRSNDATQTIEAAAHISRSTAEKEARSR